MIQLRDIPGYAEAVANESASRELSFLADMPEYICGVEVCPLTIRKLQVLRAIRSPFIVGTTPHETDVAIFLWIMSPRHAPRNRFRRYWFIRSIAHVNYMDALKKIEGYIDEAFQDSPPRRDGGDPRAYWSMSASMVDAFSREYQWTMERTLTTPLKALFQLHSIIRKRNDPCACLFNPRSDKVASEYRRKHRDLSANN